MDEIKIIIAEDHPIYADGLGQLFNQVEGMTISAIVYDGHALMEAVKNDPPHVVLTDIEMPGINGIDVCTMLRKTYEQIKIIVLSMHQDADMVLDAITAGAHCYLSKQTTIDELVTRIQAALRGEFHFPLHPVDQLNMMMKRTDKKMAAKQLFNEQETVIIQLVCQEYSTKDIAEKTNLSPKTIEKYRSRILEKTNSKSMIGAVIYAVRHGYVINFES